MHRNRIGTLFSLSLGALLTTLFMAGYSAGEDREESITLAQLPKAVRAAVKLATQGGEIEEIVKGTEDGKAEYEIEVEVDGGTVELTYNAKGQLIGIEVSNDEDGDDDEDSEDEEDEDDDNEGDEEDEDDEDDEHRAAVTQEIEIGAAPRAARQAISKRAGDAKLEGVEAITEAGKTVYEASWVKGDVEHEVTVTDDGELISRERALGFDKLPKSLKAMVKKFAAGGELKLERKTIVLYEAEVMKDGHETEILVDSAGRQVRLEIDDDDDQER